ncbi:SURF1 family cytochrome oxidase biogenesis protein [Streptomyces sp. NPDC058401]|uniref:SURF1 family cytochrome oxidase biogenesis protein n=1 Tax=Streptomyces sp. NPDC058401 TaxID=3346480 RepID=UPI00364D4D12
MNRSPHTPRRWGIHLFAALAVPFCLFMGSWQLDRFSARVEADQEYRRYQDAPARQTAGPLAAMLPVSAQTVGRLAAASGSYDPAAQFLVPGRRLDGRDGSYVLTVLRTDGGRAVPVVRGWLPGGAGTVPVPAPPAGRVTVTGALQASEHQRTRGVRAGGLPAGQTGIISAAALVNVLPYELYDAWLTVPDPPAPLRAVPPVVPAGAGLDFKAFQNLGYTGEWFVFAGFVVFMWARLRRREREEAAAATGTAAVPARAVPDRATKARPRSSPSRSSPSQGSRAEDARKDRTLRIAGAVLGAAAVAFLGWSGTVYVTGQDYSGELVAFDVLSADSVEARVSVRKGADATVVCTLRSLSEAGREVGRKDIGFAEPADTVDRIVRLRTTGRATAVELVGCQDAAAG